MSSPPNGGGNFDSISNESVLIGHADFTNGSITPSSIYPGTEWNVGGVAGGAVAVAGGKLVATYPVPAFGANFCWATFFPPPNTKEIRATFKVKFTPGRPVKFFKVHGQDTSGYANCTFQVAGDGVMEQISFGDGSTTGNDVAQVIRLDGSHKEYAGRSYPSTAVIETPQNQSFDFNDGLEHEVEAYVRFNDGTSSGNEVPNGAFYLKIDGLVYVRATGLFNRHYSNQPIGRIEWFGYVNTDLSESTGFTLSLDDVDIFLGGMPS